jgi:hypothetical protein
MVTKHVALLGLLAAASCGCIASAQCPDAQPPPPDQNAPQQADQDVQQPDQYAQPADPYGQPISGAPRRRPMAQPISTFSIPTSRLMDTGVQRRSTAVRVEASSNTATSER